MNSKLASHSIPNEVEHLKPEKARKESLKGMPSIPNKLQ